MIRVVSIITAAAFTPSVVLASGYNTVCSRGDDARTIEVVTPGEVGQSCDVRYTRSANNVSVPYHADNSDTFCNEKARALAQRLASAGFTCAASAPSLRAEADQSAQQSDYVVEAQRVAPADVPQAQTFEQPAQIASASSESEQQSSPSPVVAEPAPTSLAAAEDERALEAEMSKILEQPAPETSTQEPAQLVAQTEDTSPARPQPSPVGRLTGADPDTPRPAVSPTPAAAVASEETEAPAPAPQTSEPKKPTEEQPSSLRTPVEIVRATLMAQAAAWNEGDLDGFMEGYWKSDELKFVSGVNITRGWSATMKRYRERYGGGEGLGRLSFERIEPKLVTDDVAVVTGRFSLSKDSQSSSGVFTLVMRRDNGVWRIVHDHTTADQALQ